MSYTKNLLRILSVLPWDRILKFILNKFGEDRKVKRSISENVPDNLNPLNWMVIAEKEIGIKEIRGRKHNPRILEYHSKTSYGAKTDEVPWCSSLIVWVFEKSNIPSTRSAAARSWVEWGEECDLKRGAVVVLWRGSPTSAYGHVGLYWSEDPANPDRFMMLSGNSSNQVRISSYGKSNIIATRWPILQK